MAKERKQYMSNCYLKHQGDLLARATKRYRDNRETLVVYYREKYKPKTQRHSIYR